METNIQIRTLFPEQAPLVTVVQQRMPVFDMEFEPIAGIMLGKELQVIGGVRLIRAWIFHTGVSGGYSVDKGIRIDVPVAIELRPNLMFGATVGVKQVFFAYRF